MCTYTVCCSYEAMVPSTFGRHYLSNATCLIRPICLIRPLILLVERYLSNTLLSSCVYIYIYIYDICIYICMSNTTSCVFYGTACQIRLINAAARFVRFEEIVCCISGARQVVPPNTCPFFSRSVPFSLSPFLGKGQIQYPNYKTDNQEFVCVYYGYVLVLF